MTPGKDADMPGSEEEHRYLISSVNWLGDSVMAMPALQALRRRDPRAGITVLAKASLLPLWRLHPAVTGVIELTEAPFGAFGAARQISSRHFGVSYILPQSFRSALVPFLAGIPERIGMPGHYRDWMLTRTVKPVLPVGRCHQMWEYLELMGFGGEVSPGRPELAIPPDLRERCRTMLTDGLRDRATRTIVGIMPGAAHGPAKCWPAERFAELAGRLSREAGCGILVLGVADQRDVCARVASAAGERGSLDLCGQTPLGDLAAWLSLCDVVIANDSGGMHLAAAVGSHVVAIYGITDPERTGPIGEGHRLLVADVERRGRDLPRRSAAAAKALASIPVAAVFDAALALLPGGFRDGAAVNPGARLPRT